MKIAMVQLRVNAGQVEDNRERGLAMARQAAAGADVVVLPEIWTIGYSLKNVAAWAEDEHGPTLAGLRATAREFGTCIVAGSLPFRREGKIFNGTVVIGPSGEMIADYQKIHLFSLFGEERFFSQGEKRTLFALGTATAGLAICYDLRFPELFRAMAQEGAQLFFVPAEWPAARGDHWRLLVQTRALENQVFICAVNCVGEHKGSPFYGHSLIVAPDGSILAEGSGEEGIFRAELDMQAVAEARKYLTVWQDRRPELYR